MDDEKADELLSRVSVIINLTLNKDPEVTLTDKVMRLHGLGLGAQDIARILNKPGNQVRDALAKRRQQARNRHETKS